MDFIERWFGISPDGGDGTAEMIWIAALVGIVAIIAARLLMRRRMMREKS